MSLAAEIAKFYGQGKEQRNGAGYLTLCPVHGNTDTPALSVTDSGNGDVDVFCHGAGCDFKEIKDRFRQDNLLPEWKPEKHSGPLKKSQQTNDLKTHGSVSAPQPPSLPEKESFIWKQASKEGIEHAAKYLAGRGIVIALPVCIRWNDYTDKKTGETTHMLVAAASMPTDTAVYAVQRLFIDLETYKKTGAKMHGPCEGRGVWFNRKGDMSVIVAGEGIETTLSAMQATGKNGVATLSTSGTKNLIIPDETKVLYVLVDSDPVRDKEIASMPGQKAAYIMAQQFVANGEEYNRAFLVSPDDTCFTDNPSKLDFNDLLKADTTGESIRERFEKAVEIRDLQWTPTVKTEVVTDDDGLNDPAAINAMFDRYVFLGKDNKIIDTHGHDINDSMMIERAFLIMEAGKFYRYFDEEGDLKVIPLAKHWIMSDQKKVASGLQYKPGAPRVFINGDGRTYYNVFRFPYESNPTLPAAEQAERLKMWGLIMDQVFHKHRSYIEDWLSFTIQHPNKRSGIMPVCISGVGLGKSLVMAIVARAIGNHNFTNGKILDVTGLGKSGAQWGDWIYNKKISCIEEISPEGDNNISYQVVDALKDIITNETLALNLKGGRNGTFQIFSNIMGFSNHQNCVKVPLGDRRLFVVDSTGQEKLTPKQYEDLYTWKDDEQNIVAVYQYLRDRKISDEFIPGQAKMTRAKQALQLDSRSVMQTAFDLVAKQYPCDLLTGGELMLAVSEAMQHLEGGELDKYTSVNWKAEKQYQAIMKTSTTLVAEGKRIRVQRKNGQPLNPGRIRAIRNGQKWAGSSIMDIKDAMHVEIPWKWLSDEEDEYVPF
jgi:putative DNA primase/helicase